MFASPYLDNTYTHRTRSPEGQHFPSEMKFAQMPRIRIRSYYFNYLLSLVDAILSYYRLPAKPKKVKRKPKKIKDERQRQCFKTPVFL